MRFLQVNDIHFCFVIALLLAATVVEAAIEPIPNHQSGKEPKVPIPIGNS